jgi:hypothetical protein
MLRFYATIVGLSIPLAERNRKIAYPAQRGEVASVAAVVDNGPIAVDSETSTHKAISVSVKHSSEFVSHVFSSFLISTFYSEYL